MDCFSSPKRPSQKDLVSGGVKVDDYMRSSDPNIYAVGEVASYEGGMVYGLWKPGAEQAEVLAATLGSPSAGLRYHGSDLSTKLKLLGVAQQMDQCFCYAWLLDEEISNFQKLQRVIWFQLI